MANLPSLPSIRACLFDMDGLLIDSEDKVFSPEALSVRPSSNGGKYSTPSAQMLSSRNTTNLLSPGP